ncbi:MAG: hypothetical protein HYS44_01760 [Candidatus Niyogibacteria bacterium]|nr:hypothetical protein [Candidatus Niyogibacteria bacterium]
MANVKSLQNLAKKHPISLAMIIAMVVIVIWKFSEKNAGPEIVSESPQQEMPQNNDAVDGESGSQRVQTRYESDPCLAKTQSGDPILEVEDQPAGDFIVLKRLLLGCPIWVAVHDVSRTGEIEEWVLGAGRFHFDVYPYSRSLKEISLLRPTTDNREYAVVLYKNDGKPEFDYENREPLLDFRGERITYKFFATPRDQ